MSTFFMHTPNRRRKTTAAPATKRTNQTKSNRKKTHFFPSLNERTKMQKYQMSASESSTNSNWRLMGWFHLDAKQIEILIEYFQSRHIQTTTNYTVCVAHSICFFIIIASYELHQKFPIQLKQIKIDLRLHFCLSTIRTKHTDTAHGTSAWIFVS